MPFIIVIKKKGIFFFFFLFNVLLVQSQGFVKPGDKDIRYDLIKPGAAVYKAMTIDSMGKIVSESQVINMYSVDNKNDIFIKTQFRMASSLSTLIDTTIAELSTLKPIRMSMNTTPFFTDMNLRFEEMNVFAKAERQGKKTDTVHQMKTGYFDSNLFEYLIGILSYSPGIKYEINTYTFERMGSDPYLAECLGEESLTLIDNNKPVITYHIEVTSKTDSRMKIHFWVGKEKGGVLKQEIKLGKGMKWVVIKSG